MTSVLVIFFHSLLKLQNLDVSFNFIIHFSLQMFTSSAKIIKSGGAEPDQFEASISQAILELETNSDLKSQLRELYITKAKEIEANNKKVRLKICEWFCV